MNKPARSENAAGRRARGGSRIEFTPAAPVFGFLEIPDWRSRRAGGRAGAPRRNKKKANKRNLGLGLGIPLGLVSRLLDGAGGGLFHDLYLCTNKQI
jgi:hypothetical protein